MNVQKAIENYRSTLESMNAASPKAAEVPKTTDDFSAMIGGAIKETANTLRAAEEQSIQAAAGEANIQDVVEALTNAEMTLNTVTAVRDKVVEAYQSIMNMPI